MLRLPCLNPLRHNLVRQPCITLRRNVRIEVRTKASLSQPIFSNVPRVRWIGTGTHSTESASQIPPRSVGYWLLSCSALVFGIIVVGGVTRLTESGLSITEWKPITGVAFPRTPEQWQKEFDKYSQSPEFKMFVSSCPTSKTDV